VQAICDQILNHPSTLRCLYPFPLLAYIISERVVAILASIAEFAAVDLWHHDKGNLLVGHVVKRDPDPARLAEVSD